MRHARAVGMCSTCIYSLLQVVSLFTTFRKNSYFDMSQSLLNTPYIFYIINKIA